MRETCHSFLSLNFFFIKKTANFYLRFFPTLDITLLFNLEK